jgi:ubiquinone/menaquinone biosynthesis C-methylase UbiE
MALTQGFFFIPGWLYDGLLGTMLRKVRKRVANEIAGKGLFPCLDICCGTGSQGRAIARERAAEADQSPEISIRAVGYQAGHLSRAETGATAKTERGQDGLLAVGHGPATRVIVGLDRDCRMLRYAARRAPSMPFFCGDAAALPFKSSVFKAAVLSFALHHLSPEERGRIIGEVRRVLAPGGIIVFVEFEPAWNRASRFGAIFRDAIERLAGKDHYRNGRDFLAEGGLRAFLRENGFVERSRQDVWAGAFGVVVANDRPQRRA